MGFPVFENKHAESSLFSPRDYWEYRKKREDFSFPVPKGVIMCYSEDLLEYVLQQYETMSIKGFIGGMHLIHETNNQVAISGKFGIGAPAAALTLEDVAAFGVNQVISIGTAGSLQKEVDIGDIVVCDKAIRDEGTSYHYTEPSKYAYSSPEMTEKIKQALDRRNQKCILGTSWTTDAPYRETVAEIKQYQKEGVVTVEMEASALFAVACYRNVDMGALFTISDSVAGLEWNPQFHAGKVLEKLKILYHVAVDVLT